MHETHHLRQIVDSGCRTIVDPDGRVRHFNLSFCRRRLRELEHGDQSAAWWWRNFARLILVMLLVLSVAFAPIALSWLCGSGQYPWATVEIGIISGFGWVALASLSAAGIFSSMERPPASESNEATRT